MEDSLKFNAKEKLKISLFYTLRKLGGNKFPDKIKKPIGDFIISEKGKKDTNLLREKRHDLLSDFVEKTLDIEGNIVECGVMGGDSIIPMAKRLKKLKSNKKIFGVDYFDEIPYDDNTFPYNDKNKYTHAKGTKIPSLQDVQKKLDLLGLDNVILKKGLVEDVLPTLDREKFCLVNVDVNSYKATKFCTSFFKKRLSSKGIIFFDDYGEDGWAGATKAIDEEINDELISLPYIQAYWIKQ